MSGLTGKLGDKTQPRNSKGMCVVCKLENFKQDREEVMNDSSLGEMTKRTKLKLYGNYVDIQLNRIRKLSTERSIFPCNMEHLQIARDIRKRYRQNIEHEQELLSNKRKLIENARIGLAYLVMFLNEKFEHTDRAKLNELTGMLQSAVDHLDSEESKLNEEWIARRMENQNGN